MNRRDFLRSLAGVVFAGPLLATGPTILDGRWHLLQIINGKTTVDGEWWKQPWLTAGFNDKKFQIKLTSDGPVAKHVEIDWVHAWSDGDREVVQASFRAKEGDPFSNTRWCFEDDHVSFAWGNSSIKPAKELLPYRGPCVPFRFDDDFSDFLS